MAALEQVFDLKWSSEHAGVLPNLRWPRNSAPPVRNRTCTHRLPRDFPELHASRQSSVPENRALSAIPFRLSWELPATPGCPDQYAIAGENHHSARTGRTSDDSKLIARSRNHTHSSRCSTRRAYSISFGQSRSSQSRGTGKMK
jgi:hypothetical protein